MTLPFVRQLPNRRVLAEIALFPAIEEIGRQFIAGGGRYLCEILPDGRARIAACMLVDGEQKDVEVEITDNGPPLIEAVNRLVSASVKHLPKGTRH